MSAGQNRERSVSVNGKNRRDRSPREHRTASRSPPASTINPGRLMPPPNVSCPHCGRACFAHSLQFHMQQCARKQQSMMVPCPACNMEMPQAELNLHMMQCKAATQRFSDFGGGRGGRGGARSSRGPSCGECSSGPVSAAAVSAARKRPPMAIQPVDMDGRVPCARCGRKFSPDRIAKHQYICAGLKHGPARSPQLAAALGSSRARRPIQQARRVSGTCSARATSAAPRRPASSHWRQESLAFREAIRAARGGGRAGGGGGGGGKGGKGGNGGRGAASNNGGGAGAYGGGSRGADRFEACPHCGRTFAPAAWERHVPLCQHIVNKPRPPPAMLSVPGTTLGGPPPPPMAPGVRRFAGVGMDAGGAPRMTPLEASREAAREAMMREVLASHARGGSGGSACGGAGGSARGGAGGGAGDAGRAPYGSFGVASRMQSHLESMQSHLDELVFARAGGGQVGGQGGVVCGRRRTQTSSASRLIATPPAPGPMGRSAGRNSCMGANPETRPMPAARVPSAGRRAPPMSMGGGLAGGGGGIDPSNRTSADHPLAPMVSCQGAYSRGARR